MKDFKIGKKIMVIFGIVVVIFTVNILFSIIGILYGGNKFRDFYEYSYPLSTTTLDMRRSLQSTVKAVSISTLTDDNTEIQKYINEADSEMEGIRESLAFLTTVYRGDKARLEQMAALLEEARNYRRQVQELSQNN